MPFMNPIISPKIDPTKESYSLTMSSEFDDEVFSVRLPRNHPMVKKDPSDLALQRYADKVAISQFGKNHGYTVIYEVYDL